MVDPDPAVRDSLATLIDLNDRPVATCATGTELLLRLNENEIDCVISAAELPDMSGLELFATVRRARPDVRFAIMLNRNDQSANAAARRSGVDAVFHKPLVSRQLRHFVAAP